MNASLNPQHLEQGSPEWLMARAGLCTASRTRHALSYLKNGQPSAERRRYMIDLVSERLTGWPAQHFVSEAMAWGTATEDQARAAYEVKTGNDVDLVGLVPHPTIKGFAASPDGLVGEDGLVECKCPNTTTHIEWTMAGVLPAEHEPQCMAQMACTGRDWVDFISHDPRLPLRHQTMIVRVFRDEKRIGEIEAGVRQFLAEVDEMIERLNTMNPEPDQFKRQLVNSLNEDSDLFLGEAERRILMGEPQLQQ